MFFSRNFPHWATFLGIVNLSTSAKRITGKDYDNLPKNVFVS